jgi:hypothetical protein
MEIWLRPQFRALEMERETAELTSPAGSGRNSSGNR